MQYLRRHWLPVVLPWVSELPWTRERRDTVSHIERGGSEITGFIWLGQEGSGGNGGFDAVPAEALAAGGAALGEWVRWVALDWGEDAGGTE